MSSYKSIFNTSAYKKYMQKQKKDKKKVMDKHYSSFWWDDSWSHKSNRFAGLNEDTKATSDTVKLIKLTAYQRAVANFVKIVTKKSIPVIFGGKQSFTEGSTVTISTDISDKNFDVVVGLALHEGSHIKLTDFEYTKNYLKTLENSLTYDFKYVYYLRDVINIIEDRRIDNYVFKSSPGYRAYYHKLYDHYFNDVLVGKALRSKQYRTNADVRKYVFHIMNMTNPFFDKNALPGLSDIVALIDLKNIGRLENTAQTILLAESVMNIITKQVEKSVESNQKNGTNDTDNTDSTNSYKGSSVDDTNNTSDDTLDTNNADNASDSSEANNSNVDVPDTTLEELTDAEIRQMNKIHDKQEKFVRGDIDKKRATKKLQSELEDVSRLELDVQMVGDSSSGTFNTIIYDFVHKVFVKNQLMLLEQHSEAKIKDPASLQRINKQLREISNVYIGDTDKYISPGSIGLPGFIGHHSSANVDKGFELGSLLGRKLQVRNEERTLVYNRLASGRIDNKRLSHAGYGIENIFNQIHIDKYKHACLHISLDLSGSMSGTKWSETVVMTSAIVKAATYATNLRIQVSLRTTEVSGSKESPVLITMYDSKYNDLNHFKLFMRSVHPHGCTPEGLCFEAQIKKNLLIPSSQECTSYFLNISDGEPGMKCYGGSPAIRHTAKQVKKLANEMGIGILSFFVEGRSTKSNTPSEVFVTMYGKDSRVVGYDNMSQIARELNSKFLTEGKYTI